MKGLAYMKTIKFFLNTHTCMHLQTKALILVQDTEIGGIISQKFSRTKGKYWERGSPLAVVIEQLRSFFLWVFSSSGGCHCNSNIAIAYLSTHWRQKPGCHISGCHLPVFYCERMAAILGAAILSNFMPWSPTHQRREHFSRHSAPKCTFCGTAQDRGIEKVLFSGKNRSVKLCEITVPQMVAVL